MTSVDFAAAQQRINTRRQAQLAQQQERLHSQRHLNASSAIQRLPFPLAGFGRYGLDIWDTIRGREGTKPAFRVGQVDAELLDEELLELLRAQVGEGLKYFGPHLRDDWSSEILLALRAILFKLSIWDHNASYGAVLQDLQYTDGRHQGPLPVAPSRWQKACYGVLTVGGRYGWSKWEEWLSDQEGGYETPSRNVQLLSRISSLASTTHAVAAFTSFLVFLVNGRYRTLLDRILRMRLAPPSNQTRREVSFEYLNRQLVWHAFTEFLLFLLPLVGISRWRRWLSRAWQQARRLVKKNVEDDESLEPAGELAFLPERTCAICYQDQNPALTSENEMMAVIGASGGVVGSAKTDITNPYETIPCGCVYCYVCIATRLEAEEGQGWPCLRCGEQVLECRPWAGDVLEVASAPRRKKTVSFSDDEDSTEPTVGHGIIAHPEKPLAAENDESHWAAKEAEHDINGSAR